MIRWPLGSEPGKSPALLGFDSQDQTRIATAVSEIARNAFNYAGSGKVEYILEGRTAPQLFIIKISGFWSGNSGSTDHS